MDVLVQRAHGGRHERGIRDTLLEELAGGPALNALAVRAADGLPVLGECGGFMALVETLTTADGDNNEMAGVLPADIEMHDR